MLTLDLSPHQIVKATGAHDSKSVHIPHDQKTLQTSMIRRKIETKNKRSFEFVLVLWKIPAMHQWISEYAVKVIVHLYVLRMLVMKHKNL